MTRLRPALVAVLTLCVSGTAMAHPGHGALAGFAAGASHPLTGADHLLAMVAVGLWAGLVGGARAWIWPATFVASMAVGGMAGMAGASLPAGEPLILASLVALGAATAAKADLSAAAGAAAIALFGFAHGFAHGSEMPVTASGAAFATGFLLSTALLHGLGLALSLGSRRLTLEPVARLAGAAVALAGAGLIAAA